MNKTEKLYDYCCKHKYLKKIKTLIPFLKNTYIIDIILDLKKISKDYKSECKKKSIEDVIYEKDKELKKTISPT